MVELSVLSDWCGTSSEEMNKRSSLLGLNTITLVCLCYLLSEFCSKDGQNYRLQRIREECIGT